jgi:16S rRNA (guanine1207-N2)-methyltransferase
VTGSGVFSKGTLDEGTQLLLETLHLENCDAVCDLGCGWGPIAAFIAASWPEKAVYAVDVNPRAVQLAQWNFRLNDLPNVSPWCGDGLSAAASGIFDAVVTNPPIRAGNRVLEQFFAESLRVLRPGGVLWAVIRTAQGAKTWQKRLAAQFGSCETRAIDHGYRILECRLTP